MIDRGFNTAETLGTFGAKFYQRSKSVMTKGSWRHKNHWKKNPWKEYSIFNETFPIDFLMTENDENVTTLDKIIYTLCALINLCPSVAPLE